MALDIPHRDFFQLKNTDLKPIRMTRSPIESDPLDSN